MNSLHNILITNLVSHLSVNLFGYDFTGFRRLTVLVVIVFWVFTTHNMIIDYRYNSMLAKLSAATTPILRSLFPWPIVVKYIHESRFSNATILYDCFIQFTRENISHATDIHVYCVHLERDWRGFIYIGVRPGADIISTWGEWIE